MYVVHTSVCKQIMFNFRSVQGRVKYSVHSWCAYALGQRLSRWHQSWLPYNLDLVFRKHMFLFFKTNMWTMPSSIKDSYILYIENGLTRSEETGNRNWFLYEEWNIHIPWNYYMTYFYSQFNFINTLNTFILVPIVENFCCVWQASCSTVWLCLFVLIFFHNFCDHLL